RIRADYEKRARRATEGFLQVPLPLQRIYVLAFGEESEVEPLQPQEAFQELVRHSYAVRQLWATGTAPSHLQQCARLASCVPIFRLKRQRSLDALADLARFVEEDVAPSIRYSSRRPLPLRARRSLSGCCG